MAIFNLFFSLGGLAMADRNKLPSRFVKTSLSLFLDEDITFGFSMGIIFNFYLINNP